MDILADIVNTAKKYDSVLRVTLFGSRARGDATPKSDYDIAIFAPFMSKQDKACLSDEISELNTLYKIDLVFVDGGGSALNKNIQRDGVIIMDKFVIKFENYKNALNRLCEAVNEFELTQSLAVRDGAIQRFEFVSELAWKTLREYLLTLQITDINNPKAVLKEAFNNSLIDDNELWLDILNDRNRTSHIYDEEVADEIFENIQKYYINIFKKLEEKLDAIE